MNGLNNEAVVIIAHGEHALHAQNVNPEAPNHFADPWQELVWIEWTVGDQR
jgi:hypothetical protein